MACFLQMVVKVLEPPHSSAAPSLQFLTTSPAGKNDDQRHQPVPITMSDTSPLFFQLLPLMGLTFMLGLRHGMDPDHLAVVDNLTRYNAGREGGSRHARWCGLFFSLGHGAMVTLVAVLLALAAGAQRIPPWFDTAGHVISIAFLLLLGALNLMALARTPAGHMVAPRGVRTGLLSGLLTGMRSGPRSGPLSRLLRRATRVSHPLLVSLVGAAFAISMDTMSQAAVFSLAASGEFAWGVAVLLGIIFTAGMLAVDAANGLWVYRLIASSNASAQRWSRLLTTAIALLSIGLAVFGLIRLADARFDGWYEHHSLAIGIGCTAVLAAAWALAHLRRRAAYA